MAPAGVVVNADAGLCTASDLALGEPVTHDNCGVLNVTHSPVEPYDLGTTTVTWTVTDIHGMTATATQSVTVDKINPAMTVTFTPTTQQYSDNVTFSATLTPSGCGTCTVDGTVEFFVGTQSMGTATVTDGAAEFTAALLETVSEQMAPGPHTVSAIYTPATVSCYLGTTVSNAGTLRLPEDVVVSTDNYEVYSKVIPDKNYIICKQYTFGIEQNNSNVRHYLGRMTRRTKVVSKSEEMIDLSLRILGI